MFCVLSIDSNFNSNLLSAETSHSDDSFESYTSFISQNCTNDSDLKSFIFAHKKYLQSNSSKTASLEEELACLKDSSLLLQSENQRLMEELQSLEAQYVELKTWLYLPFPYFKSLLKKLLCAASSLFNYLRVR